MLRNNSLSVLIALFVGLSVFGAKELLKTDETGRAQAAAANIAAESGKIHNALQADILREISYNPNAVLRLKGRDIVEALKAPGLIRKDLPTVIWQYRSDQCVLDVFFKTSSGEVESARPAHYELRMRDGREDQESVAACMKNIARHKTGLRMVDLKSVYKAL